jgi:serine/threonine protein kinase
MNRRQRRGVVWAVLVLPLFLSLGRSVFGAHKSSRTEAGAEASTTESLFVLCTADGTIYSIDAWTGEFQSVVLTGSPLISHHQHAARDEHAESSHSMMVPGLDGTLYWKEDGGALQALPLTMESILEHPVRSCDPEDQHCGILTATAHTSLIALDEWGKLAWKTIPGSTDDPLQAPTTSSNADENTTPRPNEEQAQASSVLLQRKDYWIQHISSETGRQVWNATLGMYQALEFDADEQDEEGRLLPGASTSRHSGATHFPGVVFSNAGRTLAGVDLQTQSILWQIDTPTVLATVFGMHAGQWKPVHVLQSHPLESETMPKVVQQRALPDRASPVTQYVDYAELWRQHQSSAEQTHRWCPRTTCLPNQPCECSEFNDDTCVDTEPSRLELPSPTSAVPMLVSQVDGLLLSWRVVSLIVGSLLGLVVCGQFWYIRKKEKWSQATKTSRSRSSSFATNSHEDQVDGPMIGMKRTMSLPAILKPENSTALPTQSSVDIVPSAPAYSSPAPSSKDASGSIPLVRYSRYASEFQELRALGKGGFGTVFQCQNSLDGRDYAIKKILIRGNDLNFQTRLERVLREVKILAVLDHPHIVRYYTAWLELEESNHDESLNVDDDETLSRKFSSSLLTEQTDWNAHKTGHNKSPRPRTQGLIMGGEENGWRDDFGLSEEPSFIVRRTFHREISDCGFIFENSNETGTGTSPDEVTANQDTEAVEDVCSHHQDLKSLDKIADPVVTGDLPRSPSSSSDISASVVIAPELAKALKKSSDPPLRTVRHILYIQMQLCSQETVNDFLTDANARKGVAPEGVDVPTALKLFFQIAQAVQHVHGRGLIHRDLKPSNCFIDGSGNVKVGDFGLSRESTDKDEGEASFPQSRQEDRVFDNHTAGIGTRSYASPEQMNGSDYDSSTDVYSLGIILFELCYPMYTGMERNICLSQLRCLRFPETWHATVGRGFPTLQNLIKSMLSPNPNERPTAGVVAQHIQSILGEFTIQSLDLQDAPGTILLRVEAEHRDDVLRYTMQCIQNVAEEDDAAEGKIEIVQYGLRSSNRNKDKPTAVMEFALRSSLPGTMFVEYLRKRPEVFVVRQVSHSSGSSDSRSH